MFRLFYTPHHMEDLALFTRHLSGTLASRAPLAEVLKAYALEAEPGPMRRAMNAIAERVESGIALSVAMEDFPRIFPAPYRRLIRLGEEGRTLGGIVGQLADTLEEGLKSYEFIRRATMYPLLVLVGLFAVLAFVEIQLFPKFAGVFAEMGGYAMAPSSTDGALDSATRAAINHIYNTDPRIFSYAILLVLLIPIGILIGAAYGLRISPFGYGRMALQLPLVGSVLRKAEAARFSGQLALLLENRIPLAEALALLSESADNRYVGAALREFQERYEAGESFSSLLESQPLFPPGMAVMVAAAQDQGRLAETLRSLSRFYTDRTAHGVAVLREFVEPLLLLFVAIILGGALFTIYLPLFDLPSAVGR